MQETKKETDLLQEDELPKQGYYSKEILNFLENCAIANMNAIICSNVESGKVSLFLDLLSCALCGMPTLHHNDTRTIPEHIVNIALVHNNPDLLRYMEEDPCGKEKIINAMYSRIDVGIFVCGNAEEKYVIDQICLFDRVNSENIKSLIVENGKQISDQIPENVIKKFQRSGIADPFICPKNDERW